MLYDRKLFYHPSLIMRRRLFRIISHSFFGRDFYHVSPPAVVGQGCFPQPGIHIFNMARLIPLLRAKRAKSAIPFVTVTSV